MNKVIQQLFPTVPTDVCNIIYQYYKQPTPDAILIHNYVNNAMYLWFGGEGTEFDENDNIIVSDNDISHLINELSYQTSTTDIDITAKFDVLTWAVRNGRLCDE